MKLQYMLVYMTFEVVSLPTAMGMSLEKTQAYNYEHGNDDAESIYRNYGLPPDFYPAQIPNLSGSMPDFYYDNGSYIELPVDEIGCSSINSCPHYESDPYAPMYGVEMELPEVPSDPSGESKCHVETSCYASDKIPSDLSNATEALSLTYFNASTLHVGDLSSLPTLMKLHIEFGALETLEPGVFADQNNLQYLELNGNNIHQLQPHTFQELQKLDLLELTDNRIAKIQRNAFYGLKSLSVLKLGENELTNIQDDVFQEMKVLKSIHLEDNNISTISKYAFRGLSDLTALYLGHNILKRIPNRALRYLPVLEVLHMTGNRMPRITKTDFNRLDHLKEIRLDQCDIETLASRAFRGKNLTYLDISDNKLTKIGNLGNIGRRVMVQMAFNPWLCNCSLKSGILWVRNYNVSLLPPIPSCSGPWYLKRLQITELTTKQLCDPAPLTHQSITTQYSTHESDLPEGNWSDRVYDVEKLYPPISTMFITSPKSPVTEQKKYTTTQKSNITSGTKTNPPTTVLNKDKPTLTERTTSPKYHTPGIGSETTTVIHEKMPHDHIRIILIILGVTIPLVFITVLMLQTFLQTRKRNGEKPDIEMPHIRKKTGNKEKTQESLSDSIHSHDSKHDSKEVVASFNVADEMDSSKPNSTKVTAKEHSTTQELVKHDACEEKKKGLDEN